MAIQSYKLPANTNKNEITYKDSNAIPRTEHFKNLQERAYKALELSTFIDDSTYNIYLSGDTSLGRSYFAKSFLENNLKKMPTPPDFIYVYNFDDANKPILIKLPAGVGNSFKDSLAQIIKLIQKEFNNQIDSESLFESKQKLRIMFNTSKNQLIEDVTKFSSLSGFQIEIDDKFNASLYPIKNKIRITEEDFINLTDKEKNKYNSISEVIVQKVDQLKNRLSKEELKLKEAESLLDKEVIETILTLTLDPFIDKFLKFYIKKAENNYFLIDTDYEISKISNYLKNIRKDIYQNYDLLILKDTHNNSLELSQNNQELQIIKYDINVFVDNENTKGAPFIFEYAPNYHKLFACIEKETELGVQTTDFTLIKAGAIHKAIGGYLVLYVNDILQSSSCWEALLSLLRLQKSIILENYEQVESSKTKSLEPEEIPVNIKIILIGTDEIYENLVENDERFSKFFKLKAQMQDYIPRNRINIQYFLSHLALIIDDNKLLPFSKEALQYLLDYSSTLANDQKLLSLQFPILREIMIEASAYTKRKSNNIVSLEELDCAYNQKIFRKNLIEEQYYDDYNKDIIKISTTGEQIGSINALSIVSYSDYDFGLPHQISCCVSVGQDGLVSLEREVEQSGAIHAKAILILKSFLNSHFAFKKALTFNASLYFEQSYIGIDGDSASLAELMCLLTTIANIPLKQSIACTGSVNQFGKVFSVGGINPKIEAFYKICKMKGFNKEHGIIIPYDNIDNLSLSSETKEAINNNLFHIYPVKDISEAIKIYTGLQAGKLRKDGTYTENSLYRLVDNRLKELGYFAQSEYKKNSKA